jgi:hypothetical protein
LIENNSKIDLTDCYLELKTLERHENFGFTNWKDQVNINTNKLAWPNFQKGDEKIVRRKSSARINVAKLSPNEKAVRRAEGKYFEHAAQEMGFDPRSAGVPLDNPLIHSTMANEFSNRFLEITMEDGDHLAFMVRRNFYIELGFNARLSGNEIPEIGFTGFLIHDRVGDPPVKFLFEPGKKADYEEILKHLNQQESDLLPEEIEYFKKAQPWREWDAPRNP